MAKRLCRIFTLATTGILGLLNTIPVQSGTAAIEIEKPRQAQSVPFTQTAARTKISLNKKIPNQFKTQGELQDSAFVTLCSLILDDKLVHGNGAGISTHDPGIVDRLLNINTPGWLTDHIRIDFDTISKINCLTLGDAITPESISIQPLVVKKDFPFFDSHLITPLHHSITGNAAIPYEISDFDGSNLFKIKSGLNGFQETNQGSAAKGAGSPFAYSHKIDNMVINSGLSWMNDIADSRGISNSYQKTRFDDTSDKLSGVNINLGARYRALSLTGGYIRALDRSLPAQLALNGNETEPRTWTSELAYTTELLRKETILAVEYQKSSDSLKPFLPEQRYITKAAMTIFDGTIFSLEYYLDKDFSVKNGDTNGDGYGVTTKLGFEFQVDR
jgi:hypothetical protein